MRSVRRPLLLLPVFGIAIATLSGNSQTGDQAPGPYRIAGTVVSMADGHPLQRASVAIIDTADRKPVQSMTSDEYGHFAFTGVPAGMFTLQGTTSGYLTTSYDEHEGFNTGITTGAGVDTESLVLKLQPQGAMAGTILDEAAEPVQSATVHLFRQSKNSGDDSRTSPVGTENTDDLGRFEFPHLGPGTYLLAVSARPWYAVYPDPVQQERPSPSGFADFHDPSLEVAYPTTYYPGTADPAEASPILVRGGDSVDLHLQLQPVPSVSVTLPHVVPKEGQPDAIPQLRTSIFGQPQSPAGQQLRQNPTQVVFYGLAPGDYRLVDGRTPFDLSETGTKLHLSDRSTNATLLAVSGLAHVHVLLQSAHGAKLAPRITVSLVHRHGDTSVRGATDDKNEVTLDAEPGDYFFEVSAAQRYFVPQIAAGDQVLPANNIHLDASANASVTLTIVPGIHTLKGFVRKDGKPAPGTFLLLVPTAEVHEIRTFFLQQSDLDGSFSITGLGPGDYSLFAIEGGWDINWHQDAVLSRYVPAAIPVQIPDTTDRIQTLP